MKQTNNSETPRMNNAAGTPTKDWEKVAERLYDEGCNLERENNELRKVLSRWLKVADDCHLEQQEVGYSEYNITAGLVCDTRNILKP